ncbi:hypothetical protein D3C84_980320 [compost metagenome]
MHQKAPLIELEARNARDSRHLLRKTLVGSQCGSTCFYGQEEEVDASCHFEDDKCLRILR